MIRFQSKRCSACGDEKPVTEFQPKRRQCRSCRQAYVRRWKAGVRVSRQQYAETMRRVNTPAAERVDLGSMDEAAAIAYAVERYGKSGPSAADVLDAMEPDSGDRCAAGYRRWRGMVDRVVRTATR